MVNPDKSTESNRILDAIRAKRDRRSMVGDIVELEAALIADIDNFDLNAAERRARRENLASLGAGMVDASLSFPEIVPEGARRDLERRRTVQQPGVSDEKNPDHGLGGSSLLGQLRQQAEVRQRELHAEMADRSASNTALDQALKYLFFYLHDLVQQINIVKPTIARAYSAADDVVIADLVWQEGFADYRTQSQAAGAMVELVTLSYQLASPKRFFLERSGPAIEPLRLALFDYGLQFSCKEFKNKRAVVVRAEFEVSGQFGVSARWKADFANGVIILEARNLERLGSSVLKIRPAAMDQTLLDEFGRLVLDLPNRFKELAKRQAT